MSATSAFPDFRLYHGNSLEVLAGLMAETLREPLPGTGLLEPDTILIPQVSMRRWLQNVLAQAHGIAANLRFLTPGEFVREALAANLPGTEAAGSLDAATLQWRLYAVLRDPAVLRHPALIDLLPYLDGADPLKPDPLKPDPLKLDPLKPWSLAGELASVFEKYQAWRRDWLLGWEAGREPHDWQAELWRRAAGGLPHRARRIAEYLQRFGTHDGGALVGLGPVGLPTRLFAFACINISPDVLRVLSTQARVGTLHFYLPTPCRKYWGDLRTLGERLRDGDAVAFRDERDPEPGTILGTGAAFAMEENPLLEAWGIAGRDFVATLASYDVVHPSGEIAAYADPEEDHDDLPGNDSLLQRLQRDLLHRRAPPPTSPLTTPWRAHVDRTDASLQVHACHTLQREVQVLHDQLRALLEADPTLEPRDIAVLTPDIDPYLPHIEAVFGGAAGGGPTDGSSSDATRAPQPSLYLPYAVADGSPLAGEPLAEVFLRLLALPSSRFGVNEILDLLAVPAIAERFELGAFAQERLREWLGEAGARWGLNAEHRVRLDAPADATFTWQFALDRLLLGYASGEDVAIAIPAHGEPAEPGQARIIAPWPELEGSSLAALDSLIEVLRLLARCERAFAQALTPAQWQQKLLRALDELLPTQPRNPADQRALERLRDIIEDFRAQAEAAGFDAPVPPEVVRVHFQARLSEADTRAPFLSGGITFCRMVPMRLIPFRVICLLGMNDGAVPRRDPGGTLNRLAAQLGTTQRQRGDRSLREDDRFLFLQLLATAADVFYLSYLGADPRDNSRREPSVLVNELLDAIARYHGEPADARNQLVVHHSLQPFAPQAFGAAGRDEQEPEPRRFSYRDKWHPGALAMQGGRASIAPFAAATLPAAGNDDVMPREIELHVLRKFLRDPPLAFLRERLGLRLPEAEDRLPELEPFESPAGLRKHALRQKILVAYMHAAGALDETALHAILVARALLPSGPPGRLQLHALCEEVQPYTEAFVAWRGEQQATSQIVDLTIGRWRLRGTLEGLYPHGAARLRLGTLDGRAQIDHGLDWLLLSALSDPRPLVQIAQHDAGIGSRSREPIPTQHASSALEWLLQLRERGLRAPLPFLPGSGWESYANTDDDKGWSAAEKRWTGANGQSWAEGGTLSTRLALRARDPFTDDAPAEAKSFGRLSREIFDALLTGDVPDSREDRGIEDRA